MTSQSPAGMTGKGSYCWPASFCRCLSQGLPNLAILLFLIAFLACGPAFAAAKDPPVPAGMTFHGNIKSLKYHNPGCKHYNCKNCVKKFKNGREAKKAGYVACKICLGDWDF